MDSSLFIQIDNPNLNITQDNEEINRVLSPFLSLVLTNKITRIISNEIQANCTIKGNYYEKWYAKFWLYILSIGDNIN